ncbi:MAG: sensor histidine kinase, partial [Planctomycetota bacterium]
HLLSENPGTPDEVRKQINIIVKEAARAQEIVQNLLSFASPPETSETRMDVNRTLHKALDLLNNGAKKFSGKVLTSLEEIPPVKADETQFLQVFLALIQNALEAMETAAGDGHLVLKTWPINGNVHVSIADNGPGIPKDVRRRIFDPFFSTKGVGKGIGLGLPICYRIVSAYGGTITVDSLPNEGTTVEVTLPVGA